jgi:hypothetical protein
MKPVKLLSIVMLLSALIISVMSFIDPTPDYFCFKYIGPRPVTDCTVIVRDNYDIVNKTFNSLLNCETPPEIWCGFCIQTDSRYFDPITQEPKWSDVNFIALFTNGFPTEVYNNPSLHGTELGDAGGPTGVFVYYKSENFSITM